jgi:hypothetical protein
MTYGRGVRAKKGNGTTGRAGARPSHAPRDQQESPFARILGVLVASVPGAKAAALVDSQGETVDYAGAASPFDARVMAAEWRVVLQRARGQRSLSTVRWFIVGARRGTYLVHALPDGYALAMLLSPRAGFVGWHRAVALCVGELGAEAGWPNPSPTGLSWRPVQIRADRLGRPRSLRLGRALHRIEILGKIVRQTRGGEGLLAAPWAPGEQGWRVLVAGIGIEVTLLREPGGRWYADELF